MVLSILNLFLYLSISEKHINTEKEKVQIENVNFKTAFFIFKKQVFIFLILLLSYISIPQVAIYFPEYLDFFKINPKYIGIMYMIANIISMFGTKFHQIYERHTRKFLPHKGACELQKRRGAIRRAVRKR